MLVWLQHEDCFDNPTTYLPYMEGKADSKLCCKHSAISCKITLGRLLVLEFLKSIITANRTVDRSMQIDFSTTGLPTYLTQK